MTTASRGRAMARTWRGWRGLWRSTPASSRDRLWDHPILSDVRRPAAATVQRCRTLPSAPGCQGCSSLFPSSSLGRRNEGSTAAKYVGAKFHQDGGSLTLPSPCPRPEPQPAAPACLPLGNALSTKPPTSSTCPAQAAAASPLFARGGLSSVPQGLHRGPIRLHSVPGVPF